MGVNIQMVPGERQGYLRQRLKLISVMCSRRNVLCDLPGVDCHRAEEPCEDTGTHTRQQDLVGRDIPDMRSKGGHPSLCSQVKKAPPKAACLGSFITDLF